MFFDRENEVYFGEEISNSFFWQKQQNKGRQSEAVTEKILEEEFPKMRKEIPKEETFNKYGRAARQIEIAAFNEYGAIEEINESEMAQGHKLLRGRFVYTIKEKELKPGETKSDAHVSDTRRLDA